MFVYTFLLKNRSRVWRAFKLKKQQNVRNVYLGILFFFSYCTYYLHSTNKKHVHNYTNTCRTLSAGKVKDETEFFFRFILNGEKKA